MTNLDIKTVKELLNSDILKRIATQQKLSFPILERLYQKMRSGIAFENIHVVADRIVDGHHRYVSAGLAGIDLGTTEWEIGNSAINYAWDEVIIEDKDWDTTGEIEHYKSMDVINPTGAENKMKSQKKSYL